MRSRDDRARGCEEPGRAEGQAFAPEPPQVLELLERLGAGERLTDAPMSLGLSQEQARAMFFVAAGIVRRALAEPPKERCRFTEWIRRFRR
jgi:hypothetical protein